MSKRQDEMDAFEADMDQKIADLEAQAEIDKAEAEKAAKLASRGVEYGNSGFYRGGKAKDLETFSKDIRPDVSGESSEIPEAPADTTPGDQKWNSSDQTMFGNLAGVVNDPNAPVLEDMMNNSTIV